MGKKPQLPTEEGRGGEVVQGVTDDAAVQKSEQAEQKELPLKEDVQEVEKAMDPEKQLEPVVEDGLTDQQRQQKEKEMPDTPEYDEQGANEEFAGEDPIARWPWQEDEG